MYCSYMQKIFKSTNDVKSYDCSKFKYKSYNIIVSLNKNNLTFHISILRFITQILVTGKIIFLALFHSSSQGVGGGAESLIEYCCQCKSGFRTVECCAHIRTVLWFLGYGRYHPEEIRDPAVSLDEVCCVLESTDNDID